MISLWIYLNYIDPIALPLGLFILYINELFFIYFFNDTLVDEIYPNVTEEDIEDYIFSDSQFNRNITNPKYINFVVNSQQYRNNINNPVIYR